MSGQSSLTGSTNFNGATLTVSGSPSFAGPISWTEGTLQGSGTISANGGISINASSGGSVELSQATLVNAAGKTATFAGTGYFGMSSGATLINSGTFLAQNNESIYDDVGGGGTFDNNGVFTRNIGTGTFTIGNGINFNNVGTFNQQTGALIASGATFKNTGVVNVQGGTLDLQSGDNGNTTGSFVVGFGAILQFDTGTYTLAPASTISGAGTVNFSSGNVTVSGHSSLTGPTNFNGATLTASGNPSFAGPINWTEGTLQGSGTISTNGGMNINSSANGEVVLDRATLINGAGKTATFAGTQDIDIGNGATLVNSGTFVAQNNMSIYNGIGGGGTFDNSGVFTRNTGTGTFTIGGGITFYNTGTVNVQTGTLEIDDAINTGHFLVLENSNFTAAGNFTNGGTLQLGGGSFSATSLISDSGGQIFGFGTLNAPVQLEVNTPISVSPGGTTLTLEGGISGAGTGLITSGSGTLVLAGSNSYNGGTTVTSGTLQLGNTGALGTANGSLAVNGGTLDLHGFSPTVGALSGSSAGLITSLKSGASTMTTNSGLNTIYGGRLNNGLGVVALMKSGTGTLTLSGSSNYSGGTTVTLGMLQLGNALALGATTGSLAVNGGALDLHGFRPTVGALSGGGAGLITSLVSGSSTLTTISNLNTVYAGELNNGSGVVALVKSGTGTLTLSGSSNYSGGTTVTLGTLQLGNALALGATTGSLAVNGGALDLHGFSPTVGALSGSSAGLITSLVSGASTLTTNSALKTVYAGELTNGSGVLSLVKSGTGTLTLSGSNNYSGGTTISSGTVQLGNTVALGAMTGSLAVNGGTLDLHGFSPTVGALSGGSTGLIETLVSGASTLTANSSLSSVYTGELNNGSGLMALMKSGTGTLTLSGSSNYSGGTIISLGTVQLGNTLALGAMTGSLAVNGGTLDLHGFSPTVGALSGSSAGLITSLVSGASTLTTNSGLKTVYAGELNNGSGMVALVKSGTGTLTLSGSNNYSGGTTISLGTVQLGNTLALGAMTGSLAVNGGTLDLHGFSPTVGALSGSSAGLITSLVSGASTLTTNSGLKTVYAGELNNGSGMVALVKSGTGTLTLSGSNNYSGGTTISLGTVQLGNNLALGATTGSLAMNGGTLDLHGFSPTVGALSGGSAGLIETLVSGAPTLTANSSLNSVYAGGLDNGSGVVALVKSGTGTLTLSGSNNYSGGTTISVGTVQLGNKLALGAITGSLAMNGGTLDLHGFSPTVGALSGGSTGLIETLVSGASTLTANTSLSSIYAGKLNNGSGVVALVKAGTGTLTLSGSNNYSGGTTISLGTVQLGNTLALGATTASLAVNGGTLDLHGFSPTVGALSGGSTGVITTLVNGVSTLTENSRLNSVYAGELNNGSGVLSLVKSGTGTLTLSGSNSYSGGTTISAGILALTTGTTHTASLGNTAITVASGARFSPNVGASPFSKTVNAGTTGAGSAGATLTLAPGSAFSMAGSSIATFNLWQENSFSGPAFTIGGASGIAPTLTFDIGNAATGTDLMDVTKMVSVLATGGNITIDPLAGDTSLTPGHYDLITTAGGFSGKNGNGLKLSGTTLAIGGTTYDLSLASSSTNDEVLTVSTASAAPKALRRSLAYGNETRQDIPGGPTGNGIALQVTTGAVPEPSTTASLFSVFGIATAWLLRRRRN